MGYHKGDSFEQIVNWSNQAYKNKQIALIQKIATPMKPMRRGKQIIGAYYEEKSTLDYIGIYKGIPVAFDAKETAEEDKFPLKNVKQHQIDFIREWTRHGGQAFLLVHFLKLSKAFRLDWLTLNWYWQQHIEHPRIKGFHNIPLNEFESNCKEVKSRDGIPLDYLEGLI